eukprot:Nk52_evm14s553 gene=Nk52_evmTU14s553
MDVSYRGGTKRDPGDVLVQVKDELNSIRETLRLQASHAEEGDNVDLQWLENALHKAEKQLADEAWNVLNTNGLDSVAKTPLPKIKKKGGRKGKTKSEAATGAGGVVVKVQHRHVRPGDAPPGEVYIGQRRTMLLKKQELTKAKELVRDKYAVPFEGIPTTHVVPTRKKQVVHGKVCTQHDIMFPVNAIPPDHDSEVTIVGKQMSHPNREGLLGLQNRGVLPPHKDLSQEFQSLPEPLRNKPLSLHDYTEQFERPRVMDDANQYNTSLLKFDMRPVHGSLVQRPVEQLKQFRAMQKELESEEMFWAQMGKDEQSPLAIEGPGIQSMQDIYYKEASGSAILRVESSSAPLNSPLRPSPSPGSEKSSRQLVVVPEDRRIEERKVQQESPVFDEELVTYQRSRSSSRAGSSRMEVLNRPAIIGTPMPDEEPGIAKPVMFNEVTDEYSLHRFVVRNGEIEKSGPEFGSFQRKNMYNWGTIAIVLKELESLLKQYSIPIAHIDGQNLETLAEKCHIRLPSTQQLLEIIVNKAEVEQKLHESGQRYKGLKGEELAACKIQCAFRMYRDRGWYIKNKRKRMAVIAIEKFWFFRLLLIKTRASLRFLRDKHTEKFRKISHRLRSNWTTLKQEKHVIIHLPSLSYEYNIRNHTQRFQTLENSQMSRICDIRDPNVEVIYISPVSLSDDYISYYQKLFELSGAVNPQNSYKIIVPENVNLFHQDMDLAKVLLFSSKALRRIGNFIKGKKAYIVPGYVGEAEVQLSVLLDVPLLGPDPQITKLYSTKSGGKRVISSARIAIPPGERDICEEEGFFSHLSDLIIRYNEIHTWIFKINNEFNSQGLAYFSCKDLSIYDKLSSLDNDGSVSGYQSLSRDLVVSSLKKELRDKMASMVKIVNEEVYPTWSSYFESFLESSGIIEAEPPSANSTCCSIDMLIEPSRSFKLICATDQILKEKLVPWGSSFPQSSLPIETIHEIVNSVGQSCYSRGIFGYVSVDVVTFIDSQTDEQTYWAVDFKIGYSDNISNLNLLSFITNGSYDTASGYFLANRKFNKSGKADDPSESDNLIRYAVFSSRLLHSNLKIMHYSVFFNMCRAANIVFDIKGGNGTLVTLLDSFTQGMLGMVTVEKNLKGALARMLDNMSELHGNLSSPAMQGEHNFKPVIQELKNILTATKANEQLMKVMENKEGFDETA